MFAGPQLPDPQKPDGTLASSPFLPKIPDAISPTHKFLTARHEEFRALYVTLESPPRQERSLVSPTTYTQIVSEVRQHVAGCLSQPRHGKTDSLNVMIQEALDHYMHERNEPGWQLYKIRNELRTGNDRRFIFGQVPGPSAEESVFMGRWPIQRGEVVKDSFFEISAHAEIRAVLDDQPPSAGVLQDIIDRGPHPYMNQIPAHSPLRRWITRIFGDSIEKQSTPQFDVKSGYFKEYFSLGVFCAAIARACEEAKITNIFLPRSRRDPGTKPWHVGGFLQFNGSHFVWSDWGLDATGKPVKLVVFVHPRCKITAVRDRASAIAQPKALAA